MSKNKKNKNPLSQARSKCCYALVSMGGLGDFREGDKQITMYYVCTKCGRACNAITVTRKTWEINPVERIVPDKREKSKKKTN